MRHPVLLRGDRVIITITGCENKIDAVAPLIRDAVVPEITLQNCQVRNIIPLLPPKAEKIVIIIMLPYCLIVLLS